MTTPHVSAFLGAEIDRMLARQPGPAALTDGVAQLHRIIMAWGAQHA